MANEKLHEIFQPFKDEFSAKGLDLELLLIKAGPGTLVRATFSSAFQIFD
jgi:hypothetical protein